MSTQAALGDTPLDLAEVYIELRYISAGLAGLALRVAPNDPGVDSILARLDKLQADVLAAYQKTAAGEVI